MKPSDLVPPWMGFDGVGFPAEVTTGTTRGQIGPKRLAMSTSTVNHIRLKLFIYYKMGCRQLEYPIL